MKNKTLFLIITSLYITYDTAGQSTAAMKPEMTEIWEPEIKKVIPANMRYNASVPPSDAIMLFDGNDLSAWKHSNGEPAKWSVKDGRFTVKKRTGDIRTIKEFNDFQLHIEWLVPKHISGNGQSRGNSGIFLQGRYELQILDSYNNRTYSNGQSGSIYKQSPPLINAMNPPGEWNIYEVIYTAPRFNTNGTLFSPARVTVFHNGIVIQNNFQIQGSTTYIGLPKYTAHDKGPIILQDHGDPSEPISFRNIWVREL